MAGATGRRPVVTLKKKVEGPTPAAVPAVGAAPAAAGAAAGGDGSPAQHDATPAPAVVAPGGAAAAAATTPAPAAAAAAAATPATGGTAARQGTAQRQAATAPGVAAAEGGSPVGADAATPAPPKTGALGADPRWVRLASSPPSVSHFRHLRFCFGCFPHLLDKHLCHPASSTCPPQVARGPRRFPPASWRWWTPWLRYCCGTMPPPLTWHQVCCGVCAHLAAVDIVLAPTDRLDCLLAWLAGATGPNSATRARSSVPNPNPNPNPKRAQARTALQPPPGWYAQGKSTLWPTLTAPLTCCLPRQRLLLQRRRRRLRMQSGAGR